MRNKQSSSYSAASCILSFVVILLLGVIFFDLKTVLHPRKNPLVLVENKYKRQESDSRSIAENNEKSGSMEQRLASIESSMKLLASKSIVAEQDVSEKEMKLFEELAETKEKLENANKELKDLNGKLLEQPKPSERHIPKRSVIVVEIPSTTRGPREFLTMIFASWRYVSRRFNAESKVMVDILVACETKTCPYMPVDCIPYSDEVVQFARSSIKPGCYYAPVNDDYVQKWKDYAYMFMTSVEFGAMDPFKKFIPIYDFVLRTDADTFITPTILDFIPKRGSAFSKGYMGTDYTKTHLKEVANKWGITHKGITGMQSTWYVSGSKYVELIEKVTAYAEKLLSEEFTSEICQELAKKRGKKTCDWPDWHRGVVSLYASELAVNNVMTEMKANEPDWRTDMLDVSVTRDVGVDRVVCAHNIHVGVKKGEFHKFELHRLMKDSWNDVCSSTLSANYHPDLRVREKKLNEYCRDIAWGAVAEACSLKWDPKAKQLHRRNLLRTDASILFDAMENELQ